MTATDEIRDRLDELGVRYTTDDSNDYEIIEWQGPYNLWWQFVYDPYEEEPYGELRLVETGGATHLTPEQAIAATVGAGTCTIEERHGDWYCTGCGEMVGTFDTTSELYIDGNAIELWRHCPSCGKRIVEEEDE